MLPKGSMNGTNNKNGCHERMRVLFCTKDFWYYSVGLWLILVVSLVAWTRTNFTMLDGIPTTDGTHSKTQSSPSTTNQESKAHSALKQPGYRFVLNQTAEDMRIKKQYAAKDSIPLCRRYQITSGQWLSVQWEKPPYVTTVKHLRCYPAETYRQSPWRTYTWMPDMAAVGACSFAEFQSDDFCALLPRATVSIIGDSLSWEQYRSLIQLHNVPTRQGYQHQSFELNTNIQQPICDGGATAVVYRRDDTLQYVQESIDQNFPTVLVLNRGAHYVPDDQLKQEMKSLIEVIQKWLQKCEDDYKIECHFFWRTTVPGHIGCNTTERATTTPAYDLHDMEKTWIKNKSLYNDVSREYHWYDFQHQNEIVLDLLKESGLLEKLNVQVIDAYYINTLRPDEHRADAGDCLHSCFPGKMDVYNRLLLHYLKMQRSSNDIQRLQKVATAQNWPLNILTEYDEDATKRARESRLQKELEELQRSNVAATKIEVESESGDTKEQSRHHSSGQSSSSSSSSNSNNKDKKKRESSDSKKTDQGQKEEDDEGGNESESTHDENDAKESDDDTNDGEGDDDASDDDNDGDDDDDDEEEEDEEEEKGENEQQRRKKAERASNSRK